MGSPTPLVRLVNSGGTITAVGRDRLDLINYAETNKRLRVDELLARVPEVREEIRIEGVQWRVLRNTISTPDWLDLHRLLTDLLAEPAVSGAVVLHGTSLLEETAYFLHITLKSAKPVVLAGSQRPTGGISGDGEINIVSAVRVAASPQASGLGVLVCMNEEINSAREVTKTSNYRVHAFQSRDLGLLGYSDVDGRVLFYRSPTRRHTLSSEFDVTGAADLPRVDVVYAHAGCDGVPVDALIEKGTRGIVLAGVGPGTTSEPMTEALLRARDHAIPVVQSARVGTGRVVVTETRERQGFVAADTLSPHKARIVLMLALHQGIRERRDLQRLYDEY